MSTPYSRHSFSLSSLFHRKSCNKKSSLESIDLHENTPSSVESLEETPRYSEFGSPFDDPNRPIITRWLCGRPNLIRNLTLGVSQFGLAANSATRERRGKEYKDAQHQYVDYKEPQHQYINCKEPQHQHIYYKDLQYQHINYKDLQYQHIYYKGDIQIFNHNGSYLNGNLPTKELHYDDNSTSQSTTSLFTFVPINPYPYLSTLSKTCPSVNSPTDTHTSISNIFLSDSSTSDSQPSTSFTMTHTQAYLLFRKRLVKIRSRSLEEFYMQLRRNKRNTRAMRILTDRKEYTTSQYFPTENQLTLQNNVYKWLESSAKYYH